MNLSDGLAADDDAAAALLAEALAAEADADAAEAEALAADPDAEALDAAALDELDEPPHAASARQHTQSMVAHTIARYFFMVPSNHSFLTHWCKLYRVNRGLSMSIRS